MNAATISADSPLPVLITNGVDAFALLPEFTVGSKWIAQSVFGNPAFEIEITGIQGAWLHCKYRGAFVFEGWLLPSAVSSVLWRQA